MIASMIAALSVMTAVQTADEQQWVTGLIQDRNPAAAFLSWDFSSVILRATCREGDVLITYYGDGEVPHDALRTALIVDDAAFEMRRVGPAEYVLDHTGVTALRAGEWVEFDAPNEMDEAWYLGRARALKTLAASCSGASE